MAAPSFMGIDYDSSDRMIVARVRRHRRRFRSAPAAAYWVAYHILHGDQRPVPEACWQLSARDGTVFWSSTAICAVDDAHALLAALTERFDFVISSAEVLEPVSRDFHAGGSARSPVGIWKHANDSASGALHQ